jgi:hypothetical protein
LDPSSQSAGYLYTGDDPVNLSDPSGLISLGGILQSAGIGCLGGLGYASGGAVLATVVTGGETIYLATDSNSTQSNDGAEDVRGQFKEYLRY